MCRSARVLLALEALTLSLGFGRCDACSADEPRAPERGVEATETETGTEPQSESEAEAVTETDGVPTDPFAPELNDGEPPPRDEQILTGMAMRPDGEVLARTWSYEDMSDEYAAFSGSIELWNVRTGELERTITGIPGSLCLVDPGRKDCVQWRDQRTIGFVFNTNAVGTLDTRANEPHIATGVGDPTGTDAGRPWAFLPDGRLLVSFHADYRQLGGAMPLSIWDPKAERLIPVDPPNATDHQRRLGIGRLRVTSQGRVVGIGAYRHHVVQLSPPRIAREIDLEHRGPGRVSGTDQGLAPARDYVSPDARWLLGDEPGELVLYRLPDGDRVRRLATVDAADYPSMFCWSRQSDRLAVVVRRAKWSARNQGRLLLFDDLEADADPRALGDPPRSDVRGGPQYRRLCAFDRAGDRLALLYPDRIEVVDVATLKPVQTLRPELDPFGVAFGAGDSLVVWSDEDVAFFDARTGERR